MLELVAGVEFRVIARAGCGAIRKSDAITKYGNSTTPPELLFWRTRSP